MTRSLLAATIAALALTATIAPAASAKDITWGHSGPAQTRDITWG